MHYVITKHAQQRRSHHTPRSKLELLSILEIFNVMYEFDSLENGKYKILKGKNAAIFAKDNDLITLITIRGFKDGIDFFNADNPMPCKKVSELKEEKHTFAQKKKEWTQLYPAIFEELSDDSFAVIFPDLIDCEEAYGNDLESAYLSAINVLSDYLSRLIANGENKPSISLHIAKEKAVNNILVMIEPKIKRMI